MAYLRTARAPLVIAAAVVGLVAWGSPALATVETRIVVEGLDFATNMVQVPDGRIFFTEKDLAEVRVIENGELVAEPFARVNADTAKEQGLLGIAAHPNFEVEPWIYLYFADAAQGRNRIVRFRADGNHGADEQAVIDLLPTASGYHNGGDITFGPDGKLYVTTGEGHDADLAQDPTSVGGKILRLEPDGSIPADNPLGPNNPVFSLGHRNSFGLCFDGGTDELWMTENGPDANDEVNQVEAGKNYGWPIQSGPPYNQGYEAPVLNFADIIVPTGCAAFDGKVLFGDFSGRLHSFEADDPEGTLTVAETFASPIIDVYATSDAKLYVVTTGSILEVTDIEIDALEELPSPSPAAGSEDGSAGESLRTEAWISGLIALIVVIGGGIALRRWQRRNPKEGSQPPPEAGA